ncbi:hypothetical protein DPEC_G00243720 [Dallia pectoralis]|uniref:Uncharacterized protein n=1 Tax=Dallia pectoralis TaxID=75939 RepID=A0ACC2FVM4_DALPE|nr:hypothetical protein DPEC_G00243720 [Dallia pectoralis]
MAHAGFPTRTADVAANLTLPVLGRPLTLSVMGRLLCANGTPWILYLFEECVENVWEYWSVVIGLVSILCFLLSTLPQVYEAYRNGKVEEAMSFGFPLFLFSGDLSSLIGCVLTPQLPIQIVAVVFYIFTDLLLISQFLYYKIKNRSSRKSTTLKWLCFLWFSVSTMVLLSLPKFITDNNTFVNAQSSSNSLTLSGYACGYLASIFFLSSRFPQIYKNFKRQSTEGTSYMLFALAMMGNGTYGLIWEFSSSTWSSPPNSSSIGRTVPNRDILEGLSLLRSSSLWVCACVQGSGIGWRSQRGEREGGTRDGSGRSTMGNGVCSRRQRRIFQSLLLITVVCGIMYGGMISYEMQTQLKRTEAMALKYQQHQESLSAQLQVVYEHRSRLEKSLQKERVEHKKAKEDFLVYKLEAQQSLNKEKQDSSSRLNSLHVQHQMLKNQHDDLKKQYYGLQEQHQVQVEDHGKAIDEHKDRLEKLQQIKEVEVSKLKENMYNLREENKQLRKAHQDIHVQLQDSRIQHNDLKSAHDQLALTLEDHKSALAAAQVQVDEYKQLKEKLVKMPNFLRDQNPAPRPAQPAAVVADSHERGARPPQPPTALTPPNGKAHGYREDHQDTESRLDLQEKEGVKPDLQSQPAMSNNAEQEKDGYGEVEGEAERRRELAEEEMEQAGLPQKLEEELDQPQDDDALEGDHDLPDDNALDRQKLQPHTDPQSDIHLVPETHLQQEAHGAKSQVERVKSAYEQQLEQQRLEAERVQRTRDLQLAQQALQAQRAKEQREREVHRREVHRREVQHNREADHREKLLKEEQLRKKSHYENMDEIVRDDQDPNVDDGGEADNLQLNQKQDDVDQRVPEGVVEGELDPENDPNNQGEDEFDVAEDQHPHPREEEEEEEKAPAKHPDTNLNHPAVDEEPVMAVNPDQQEDNLDEQYQEEGEDEVQEDLGQIRAEEGEEEGQIRAEEGEEEVEDHYNEDNGQHQDDVKFQELPAGKAGEHKMGENNEENYEEDEEEVVVRQDERPNRREM